MRKPEKEEYGYAFTTERARGRKVSSNEAEMPQPTPASLGVLTACDGTPAARKCDKNSRVCDLERNTAKTVIYLTLPSYIII